MKKKMKMPWGIIVVAALAVGLGVYWLSMRRCVVHQTPGMEMSEGSMCPCTYGGPCDCMEKMGYCDCGNV